MTVDSYIDKGLKEREKFTPKSGFNVVQFDDFEDIGEKLTLLAHFDSLEDAEKFAQENNNEEIPVYVYGPEDEE